MSKIYILVFVLILYACNINNNNEFNNEDEILNEIIDKANEVSYDLSEIKKDGKLKAITIFSSTSYFLYKGKPMGFEYELLERLANHLNLKLEIIVAHNIVDLFKLLNQGKGDIIAHGITITKARKNIVNFTDYYFLTNQVLVQRKPDNWRKMKIHQIDKLLVKDPVELIDKKVSVRKNSSYYYRLKNLSEEIGEHINIETLPGDLSTDRIIKMVVDKEIEYTVADNNIAAINKSYYPILDINTKVSFSQRIAWAVRKSSPKLLHEVNKWIKKMKSETDYYVIYNKYYKNKKQYTKRKKSKYYSLNSGAISQYDDFIKKYSKQINWDWRLLAALIYQESQFNPKAESWAKAKGLMQMMQTTAREMGVKNIEDPEDNIKGGTKYLKLLWDNWNHVPEEERYKFVLASYNCGYNHVRDAIKLAKKYGKNPKVWTKNVDEFILKLTYPKYYNDPIVKYGYVRGTEPYNYVVEILDRYNQYKNLIKE